MRLKIECQSNRIFDQSESINPNLQSIFNLQSSTINFQFGIRLQAFPLLIDERKSAFVFVLAIFDSSSSIASTGDSGVNTLRSTQTRLRSSFGSSSSSLRVPLFW